MSKRNRYLVIGTLMVIVSGLVAFSVSKITRSTDANLIANLGISPSVLPTWTPLPTIVPFPSDLAPSSTFTYIALSPFPSPERYEVYDFSPTAIAMFSTPVPTQRAPFPSLTFLPTESTTTPVARISIILQVNPSSGQIVTEDDMNTAIYRTSNIISARRGSLRFDGYMNIESNVIYFDLLDVGNLTYVLATFMQQGVLEIIDLSDVTLDISQKLLGSMIYTTGHQHEYSQGDGLLNPITNTSFETVVLLDAPFSSNVEGNQGIWYVNLRLNYANGEQLLAYTQANIGSLIGIVLDGRLIAIDLINRPIIDLQIRNDIEPFTFLEAESIATVLRGGALPFPVEISFTITDEN